MDAEPRAVGNRQRAVEDIKPVNQVVVEFFELGDFGRHDNSRRGANEWICAAATSGVEPVPPTRQGGRPLRRL